MCAADQYLLQIQPYNFNSKSKTEASKTEQSSTGKGEGEESATGGQRDASPQWYDVDIVKGTQCTVTGYTVRKEGPQDAQTEVE